jgi:hypothetical protein
MSTTPNSETDVPPHDYTLFLAAQGLSDDLSRIQGCLEFFGETIVTYHKNDEWSTEKRSTVASGITFDLQQYAAYTGKSLEFFLNNHLSSGELLEWPTKTSKWVESLDIKRFERRVELEWPADLPYNFQEMLRGMKNIIERAYEIQTQLQLGIVQVTRLKALLQTIAGFITEMCFHIFPDPQCHPDRIIHPATTNIPKEVVLAMVETETKTKRSELKTIIDDIQLRVKDADRSIFTSTYSAENSPSSTSTIKKKARMTGAQDGSTSFFPKKESHAKREKLKPKLPTACFTSFPTQNP